MSKTCGALVNLEFNPGPQSTQKDTARLRDRKVPSKQISHPIDSRFSSRLVTGSLRTVVNAACTVLSPVSSSPYPAALAQGYRGEKLGRSFRTLCIDMRQARLIGRSL